MLLTRINYAVVNNTGVRNRGLFYRAYPAVSAIL